MTDLPVAQPWNAFEHRETDHYGSKRLVVHHNGHDELYITAADGQVLRVSFNSDRYFEITGSNGMTCAPGNVGGKNALFIKTEPLSQVKLRDGGPFPPIHSTTTMLNVEQ